MSERKRANIVTLRSGTHYCQTLPFDTTKGRLQQWETGSSLRPHIMPAYVPFKWNVQRVQTLPTPNQGLMKPTQSTGGGTLHQQNQSQSSDPDNSCEGQLFTLYESCGSDANAEGYDESGASCCCDVDGAAVVES